MLRFPPRKPHAYVWLFMKGDFYLPGIFVSAWSIARTNPDADLVVCCTPDISEETRSVLLRVVDNIFSIDYLEYPSRSLRTERQRELYSEWISVAYTKWQNLNLPYKKIIQIDGDTAATCNLDELFDLPAPAMPLASPFTRPLGNAANLYLGETGPDGYPAAGALMPAELINESLRNCGTLPISTPAVIEPSKEDFAAYRAHIERALPYGSSHCNSTFDEQSISDFYTNVKGKQIYCIHHRYNYYPWKDGFLFPGEVPRVIHFFSDTKPWTVPFDKYPDVTSWYRMADEACTRNDTKPSDIAIRAEDCIAARAAPDTFMEKFIHNGDILRIKDMF